MQRLALALQVQLAMDVIQMRADGAINALIRSAAAVLNRADLLDFEQRHEAALAEAMALCSQQQWTELDAAARSLLN